MKWQWSIGALAVLAMSVASPVTRADAAPVGAIGWTGGPPLGLARAGLEVATVPGQILAIGGFNGDLAAPAVYDTVEVLRGGGRWRTVAPMPTARSNPAAAALGGDVYVAGGFTAEQTFDVVERFDAHTGVWHASTKLPAPAGAMGAAALGDRMYVAGGLVTHGTDEEVTAAVYAFDPALQTWTAVAPMPTPRWRLRLVAAGGQLYAIGGQAADDRTLTTVERYDPRTDTWATMPSMRQDRALPGVTTVQRGDQHLIVVVGGAHFEPGAPQLLRTTEVYDLRTGAWHTIDALLPHGTASLVCATQPDGTVLAIGGASDRTNPPSATDEVNVLATVRVD